MKEKYNYEDIKKRIEFMEREKINWTADMYRSFKDQLVQDIIIANAIHMK